MYDICVDFVYFVTYLTQVGGERPAMDPVWPLGFQELLKDCWNRDPSLRPDIVEVRQMISTPIQLSTRIILLQYYSSYKYDIIVMTGTTTGFLRWFT